MNKVNWTDIDEPNEDSPYTHIFAKTPIGTFSIEWKSWNRNDLYYLNLNERELDLENYFLSLEEAKEYVYGYLLKKSAELIEFLR